MRDIRFVAVHRGGQLTKDNHKKLIGWAVSCSEHVLPLFDGTIDMPLIHAITVAKEWEKGNSTTGEAIKSSREVHALAKKLTNPVSIAVARSIGHAVATAHMADHSLGGALYALQAVKLMGKSLDAEREWQLNELKKLPPEIVDLVLATMKVKEKGLKIQQKNVVI